MDEQTINLPSLDTVYQETKEKIARQIEEVDTANNKAGIIIGFTGAMLATLGTHSAFSWAWGCSAILAVAFAFKGYRTKSYHDSVGPDYLRDNLIHQPEQKTKLVIIDSLIEMIEHNKNAVSKKNASIKYAFDFSVITVLILIAGNLIKF